MSLDDVNGVEPRLLSIEDIYRLRFADGEPPPALPDVLPLLAQYRVRFRLGELSLVAGPPGHGKSVLGLTLAVMCGLPSMYLTLDTSDYDTAVRVTAMVNGITTDDVESAVQQGRAEAYFAKTAANVKHVRFVVRPPAQATDMIPDIEAMKPKFIVVDNLTDVGDHYGAGTPHEVAEGILQDLKRLARRYGVHIMALHHVTGAHNDGNAPIPLSGIKGQIGRIPALVLTVRRDRIAPNMLIYIAKNRYGPELETVHAVDLPRMRMLDARLYRPDGTWVKAFPSVAPIPSSPDAAIGYGEEWDT